MKRTILVLVTVIALLPVSVRAQLPHLTSEKKFNFGGNSDQPAGIFVDYQNNFIINGIRNMNNGSSTGVSPIIVKYSYDGAVIWSVLDTTKSAISGLNQEAILSSGYIFQSFQVDFNQSIPYLKGLDSNGNELWRKKMDGITYLASWEDTLIAIVQSTNTVQLMDRSGKLIRSFSLGRYFGGYIAPTVTGNFLCVSGLSGNSGILSKYYLPTGEIIWAKSIPLMVTNPCAMDDSGNVYLGGSRLDTLNTLSCYLTKFDGDGNQIWEEKWFPRNTVETNHNNFLRAIAVSSKKNSVVVGGSFQAGNSQGFGRTAFIKEFSASSGDTVWEKKWDYEQGMMISQISDLAFDRNDYLNVLGNSVPYLGQNYCYIQIYNLGGVLGVPNFKSLPTDFSLSQNYPNPFNPSTTIEFSLPKRAFVNLTIYNTLGQVVETLVSSEMEAGAHQVIWKANNIPSGTYFYRLIANNFVETKKMLLMK